MADDLIRNDGPKVKAQIVITVFDAPDGAVGQLSLQTSGDFNEIIARFMISKATAMLDEHWKQAMMPRIMPGNGVPMPDALRKHLRG